MPALAFIAVMAVIYFVGPYAAPSFHPTLVQSAAITLIAFVARAVLCEGVTVKLDGIETVSIYEGEDD